MSWSDFHLNDPEFMPPLPIMSGLVSAAIERRDAIDSDFHESCVSSGMSAVAESHLTSMLLCSSVEGIPFRLIHKEYTMDPLHGGHNRLSFMHMFDNFLIRMLSGYGTTYDVRHFTDSTGVIVYSSLYDLASALSETLILSEETNSNVSSSARGDLDLMVCLNASWAMQRVRMLGLLRYVSVGNGGLEIQYAFPDAPGYGSSPQAAYNGISSWDTTSVYNGGYQNDIRCCVEYFDYPEEEEPDERWAVDDYYTEEATALLPDFHGCPAAEHGELRFDAVPISSSWGCESIFDPLCTTVSSGANTFVLSGGSFASWGYGSASAIGGPDTPSGMYMRGWQAANVKIIYDYESTFRFKS